MLSSEDISNIDKRCLWQAQKSNTNEEGIICYLMDLIKSVTRFFTSNDLFTDKNDLKSALFQQGKCNNFSARGKDVKIRYIV